MYTISELNDTQLETISGGNYYTWRCNHTGGSGGGGAGSGAAPVVANPVFHNIYIGPTNIENNNTSVIDLSHTTINGTLVIDVNQTIYN